MIYNCSTRSLGYPSQLARTDIAEVLAFSRTQAVAPSHLSIGEELRKLIIFRAKTY